MGIFDRLKQGLTKTRKTFQDTVATLVHRRSIDAELYDELEEKLLAADIGFDTTTALLERMKKEARRQSFQTADQLIPVLKEAMDEILTAQDHAMHTAAQGPTVILVVGVNGVGKTTTIGKLAHRYTLEGKRVMIAAGDTFRAAAIEQLAVWAERANVPLVRQAIGSDAAAVIFDAVQSARARQVDVLLCDTAGRLQNKSHLMDELRKIVRIMKREIPDAPHEVLLVVDATTGQNALSQAALFKEVADVTGVILTKLDGTAKGGVILPISRELNLPIKWIGIGEQIDDLQPFMASSFSEALFSPQES